ncbi:MAG: lactonase family protein [Chloroflexi bacterium]|nr:lactonase family protein [Chloroflexota bacterium]MBI3339413.1 lactonase family protein [Chloroflexota bacterium]
MMAANRELVSRQQISPTPIAIPSSELVNETSQFAHSLTNPGSTYLLYIGTYSGADADSIYIYLMDPVTGMLEFYNGHKAGANPSFLSLTPNGQFLYAVNQLTTFQGQPGGAVSAFAINPISGKLSFLNQQPSHGSGPCHLTTDRQGRFLLVANYLSGTLSVYPIHADGRLEIASQVVQHHGQGVAKEQEGPHAHFVTVTSDNRFALSCDLGIDKVLVYQFDSVNGSLLTNGEAVLSPGSGPRHLDFHPNGGYIYLINELNSTMTVLTYNIETGTATQIQTLSTLPEGYEGPNSCAEVWVHPSGKFVYGSNRGHDSIAIFAIEAGTGRLRLVGHEPTRGKTPRYFVLDPIGRFLLVANQNSNTVVNFQINTHTGRLSYLQHIDVPKPVCVKFWTVEKLHS